jgi:hypothetical protein
MAPLDGKLVLFGGNDGNDVLSDTWTWDGTAWTQVMVAGPSARLWPMMALFGTELVLSGGERGGFPDSETWTWDGSSWMQLHVTGPPARYSAVMTTP